MTRAEKRLVITRSRFRTENGRGVCNPPSRFLAELSEQTTIELTTPLLEHQVAL
jgi:superfamily I DNA/RNA helicase